MKQAIDVNEDRFYKVYFLDRGEIWGARWKVKRVQAQHLRSAVHTITVLYPYSYIIRVAGCEDTRK